MIAVKIILRLLLALLIIIAAALAVPTRVYIRYSDELFLQVRYLFIKIQIPVTEEQKQRKKAKPSKLKEIFSRRNKKFDNTESAGAPQKKTAKNEAGRNTSAAAEGKKKRSDKKKKPNPVLKWLRELHRKGGAEAIIQAFKKIADLIGTVLKPIFKHIRIKQLNIDITAASDNAADTALNYGRLCAGIYPALSIILNVVKYDDYSVNIRPDFNKSELEADISAELSLIPWVVIGGALHALVKFLVYKVKGEL